MISIITHDITDIMQYIEIEISKEICTLHRLQMQSST